jgi:multisubunit Na+/H+ antiporter MnhG subunit
MDLALLVYAISLLSPIGTVATAITVISCCAVIALMLYRAADCSQEDYYNAERNKKQKEKAEWAMGRVGVAFKVMIPAVIVLILLPTPKTAYIMVGAYAAQKVVENKSVQDTGGKVLTLINQKLDHYIDEGIAEATKVPEKAKEKVKKAVE